MRSSPPVSAARRACLFLALVVLAVAYVASAESLFAQRARPQQQRPQQRNGAESAAAVPDDVTFVRDIAYREGNDAWKLDLAMPKEAGEAPRPAIVFVHGGGWRGGDKGAGIFRQGALDYAGKGYVCISVNYRLTGEAPFPACVEDVKCAVRWLRAHAKDYNLDPERIGAFGNSAGAHLVAMLGLVGPDLKLEGDGPYQDQSSLVQAVCCAATPTDFSNWGIPGKSFRGEATLLAGPAESLDARKKLASPITHVAAGAPPFLVVHGTADGTVPHQQGESFAKQLKAAGAKDVAFLSIEGQGHGVFTQSSEKTFPAMEQFFARVLRHASTASGDEPAAEEPPRRGGGARANPQRGGRGRPAGGRNATAARPRDQKPSWLMPPVSGPNLHYKTFDSKAAGEKVSYLIYLPPDYETSKEKRYPIVYWLHGIGGSQTGVPRMAERLTEAIGEGKAPAMIVVFVNGMIRSSYVDAKDGSMPVETVAIEELIPHVDTTYRTIATRDGRMIEGFSMGGAGAAKWGLRHPDLFGSISILDGALHSGDPSTGRIAASFQSIYGGDREYYDARNPWKLAEKNAEKLKGRTPIRIVTRTAGLSSANEAFHEHLKKLGLPNELHKISDAPHSPNPLYDGLGDKNWDFYQTAFKKATEEN